MVGGGGCVTMLSVTSNFKQRINPWPMWWVKLRIRWKTRLENLHDESDK